MIKGNMNYAVTVKYLDKDQRTIEKVFAVFKSERSAETFTEHMNRINLFPCSYQAYRIYERIEIEDYTPIEWPDPA